MGANPYNAPMSKKKPKISDNTIAINKKARHDFFIEDDFEAGMVLEGWEVKSLRAGKVQIRDSHVFVKNGEAWLSNATITPATPSSPGSCQPSRFLSSNTLPMMVPRSKVGSKVTVTLASA